MKKVALAATVGYLAATLALAAWSPASAGEASVVQSTETVTAPAGPPQVLDSYMKPVLNKTTQVTDSEGNTTTETMPMIMERHEKVAIPGNETHVTTVRQENYDASQTTKQVSVKKAVAPRKTVRRVSYRPRPRRYVAYKPVHKYVASANKVQKAEQSTQHTVIQEQTYTSPTTVIERRDPALDDE